MDVVVDDDSESERRYTFQPQRSAVAYKRMAQLWNKANSVQWQRISGRTVNSMQIKKKKHN